MTETLWFEANEEKAAELNRLASQLGASQNDLLNEALDLLLSAHRGRQQGEEPIGVLAAQHDVIARTRRMIEELKFIRFTTCGVTSMLSELGIEGRAFEAVSRHYEKIYDSSERALAAAGFGPMLVTVVEAEEHSPSGTDSRGEVPHSSSRQKRHHNE